MRIPFISLLRCALLFVGISCASAGYAEPESPTPGWENLTKEAAFSPRDTAEGVVYQDKLWLSNGYYHGNVLSRDLWTSDDGVTWTVVNEATPYDGYSEMVVYRDALWAVKGSVWTSKDGVSWTQVLDKTPFGVRGYGELVVHQDALWQLGSGADVWRSTDGAQWTEVSAEAPYGKREAAAVTVVKDKLWVVGGKTPGANTPPEKGYPDTTTHNDVWNSADGETWERVLEHAPWAPRQWFTAEVYRDRLWIIGGYDNVHGLNFDDVWYTEDGVTWHRYEVQPVFSTRHEPTTYVHKGALWVVAGNTWPVLNDVWRLTLPEGWTGE